MRHKYIPKHHAIHVQNSNHIQSPKARQDFHGDHQAKYRRFCQQNSNTSQSHRSTSTRKSDERWVDGPKHGRRKKDICWTQELWVDGPNAKLNGSNNGVHFDEKQQRIQQWIKQNTNHIWPDSPSKKQTASTQTSDVCNTCLKSPPSKEMPKIEANVQPNMVDIGCQTDLDQKFAVPTYQIEWNYCEDPLKALSDDELLAMDRLAGSGRDAYSDCYDHDYTACFDDNDDVQSEPITEPPKQLKLEQFLQQLTTITTPHKHFHQDFNLLRRPEGNSDTSLSILQWECAKADIFEDPTIKVQMKLPPSSDLEETLLVTTALNHAVLPTSPRVNRLLSGTTSLHNSPTKSISRKQHKLEHDNKRNTISTTTSGHGTTSEGDSTSSVAKKSVCMQNNHLVQSQPASSGYESTIQDDDSDRGIPITKSGHTRSVPANTTPVKMRTKKSKNKSVASKEKDKGAEKRDSGNYSFLCCKFMEFY